MSNDRPQSVGEESLAAAPAPSEKQVEDNRLQLEKETLQDLTSPETDADAVRGGAAAPTTSRAAISCVCHQI